MISMFHKNEKCSLNFLALIFSRFFHSECCLPSWGSAINSCIGTYRNIKITACHWQNIVILCHNQICKALALNSIRLASQCKESSKLDLIPGFLSWMPQYFLLLSKEVNASSFMFSFLDKVKMLQMAFRKFPVQQIVFETVSSHLFCSIAVHFIGFSYIDIFWFMMITFMQCHKNWFSWSLSSAV